ncbi:efflux RND transporter periplasmic adaptor subunit [Aphanothece hegewaldii CCALA 016]|uniref:Efflux RND transporter periplasmic adaptor subunit n=1 Tax=Aphanothece hegewaldii CCALA 016 TaxID=2107694 RepID=A0A2T1LZT7_9CHRO|nr:efflux RND transporter periplasmic adaptor subunit [Aphanothece hegewaldii]PSF37926.1 efflux RND transporter periplasmic adaptor subunit [Aphanothece hegewaldii CCALA 016]
MQDPKPLNQSQSWESSKTEPSNPAANKSQKWLPIAGIILLAIGGVWGWNSWKTSQNAGNDQTLAGQPPAMPVKLMTVQTGTVEDKSEVLGTLEANRAVTIKSEVAGRISNILVKEGDRVQAGQVLYRLDSEDLEAQLLSDKAKLENAKARLAQLEKGNRVEDIAEAQARVREAQARLINAKSGAPSEEIAQAQAQLASAQASADLANQRVKRYSTLSQEGAISEDQYQEYLTIQRNANAAVNQAKRRISELSKGRQSDINELAAGVEREAQNLRRIESGSRVEEIAQGRADVAEATAQVRLSQVNVNKTRVVAPISGTVGDIPTKIGDYVDDTNELTTVTTNDDLEINLSIPLEQAPRLRLGLPVEILDPQGKVAATGKINFISPDVNSSSQLILAKADISNLNGSLLNRQFIEANVIWDRKTGILVPTAAISRLGGQTFVYVAQKVPATEGKPEQTIAKQRSVKLGSLQGNNYQVLEGLKAGETIITAGLLNVADGVPIQPMPQ